LTVSNRNDSSFQIENYNPRNQTLEPSDSLATYRLRSNGKLSFVQLAPAGGIYPRNFAFNKAGDRVAVPMQTSERLVVLERNATSGRIGSAVADLPIEGELTAVIWDEQ